MELINDLQKSSTTNIANFYPDDAVLSFFLTICEMNIDDSVFYSNLNKNNVSRKSTVKNYYKHITKFY